MERVKVVYAEGDAAVGTYERVLITYLRGPLSITYLDEAHRAGKKLAKGFPRGIASLTLAPLGAAIPEKAVRERARINTHEANTWVGAGATVIGGEGFAASAARSVVTAITLFSAGPPRRVFSKGIPAIAWLAAQLRIEPSTLEPLIQWTEVAMGDDYGTALSA